MNPTELGLIISVLSTVAGLAEKYGPEVYETVITALSVSKSTNGPTLDQISAILDKCKADNEAIQSS